MGSTEMLTPDGNGRDVTTEPTELTVWVTPLVGLTEKLNPEGSAVPTVIPTGSIV